MDNKFLIPSSIVLAGVMVAGALLYSMRSPILVTPRAADFPDVLKIKKSDFVLGNPAAKVVLVEYGDFQCPFCGKFFKDAESAVREKYIKSGKVAFVWRDFAFLGEESFKAAEAARCAGDQGRFWEYHDYLFNNQKGENRGTFKDLNLKSFAKFLRLNEISFIACLDSGTHRKGVEVSVAEGKSVGVSGTPTTFVNGKAVSGAISSADISAIIEPLLK